MVIFPPKLGSEFTEERDPEEIRHLFEASGLPVSDKLYQCILEKAEQYVLWMEMVMVMAMDSGWLDFNIMYSLSKEG